MTTPHEAMPAWARVAALAVAACALFAAVATVGTRDDPFAPNGWLFSHVHLAQVALDTGTLPMNMRLLTEHSFTATLGEFREQSGLERMTFYATTTWHFWNGLPLQPALVAGWATMSGTEPEVAVRAPLAGIVIVLLTFAAADLALSRSGGARRTAVLAPLLLACAAAPLALDLRVLMPSASLVLPALLLHLVLRRRLLGDDRALLVGLPPLLLLPFWYYTVSYLVMTLLAAFLVTWLAMRAFGDRSPPLVPPLVAAALLLAMVGLLVLNGALTSHLEMAARIGASPLLAGEGGADYTTYLNREPWRSGMVYAQGLLLFAPLAWLGLEGASRALLRRHGPAAPASVHAILVPWCAGAAAFSLLLQGAVGVSFLNRTAVYFAPVAAVAACLLLARSTSGRRAAPAVSALLVLALASSVVLVATATPTTSTGDQQAMAWLAATAGQEAVAYSSLEVASVLFRHHGMHDVVAFHPRLEVLDRFWYSTHPDAGVAYLASVEWFVLRDDVKEKGFEEFGPLRRPVSDEAYAKFGRSPHLRLAFDNGEAQVFEVALHPGRLRTFSDA